jgi:hypothetical protein
MLGQEKSGVDEAPAIRAVCDNITDQITKLRDLFGRKGTRTAKAVSYKEAAKLFCSVEGLTRQVRDIDASRRVEVAA